MGENKTLDNNIRVYLKINQTTKMEKNSPRLDNMHLSTCICTFVDNSFKKIILNLVLSLLISQIPIFFNNNLFFNKGFFILSVVIFYFSFRFVEYLQTGKHIWRFSVETGQDAKISAMIDLFIIIILQSFAIYYKGS